MAPIALKVASKVEALSSESDVCSSSAAQMVKSEAQTVTSGAKGI
jgi:hypothetical protein